MLKLKTATLLALGLALSIAAPGNAQNKKAKLPPGVAELELGSPAPDFALPGTDGKTHSLKTSAGAKGTLVVFTCNHCPYAKAYEDRIIALTDAWSKKGISVVAISTNDADAFPEDGFAEMKVRAREKKFNFPYLYDATQEVALAYGPMVTPHIFLFDAKNVLVYRGRIDDSAKEAEVAEYDLANALTALTSGKAIKVADTKAFGCSIKWKPQVLASGKPAKDEAGT